MVLINGWCEELRSVDILYSILNSYDRSHLTLFEFKDSMRQQQFEKIQGSIISLSGIIPLIYRREINGFIHREPLLREPTLLYTMVPIGISIYITSNLTELIHKFIYPYDPEQEYEDTVHHSLLPQELRNVFTGLTGLYLYVQKDRVLQYIDSPEPNSMYRQYFNDFTRFVITMGYVGGSMGTFYQLISAI